MPSTVILRTLDGDIELSHAFRKVAKPDGSTMIDLSANGGDDGEGVDLHASTHEAGGSDELLVSTLAGILGTAHGGTGVNASAIAANRIFAGPASGGAAAAGFRTAVAADIPNLDATKITSGLLPLAVGGTGLGSYTAGDTLYYASGTALSKLGIGASGTIYTSTGSAPQWVASLTKAQQHAQTAYLDAAQSWTAVQSFTLRTNIASQTGGTGLIIGDQSVTSMNSLGSNLGLDIYADFNAAPAGINYINRSTGTSAGLVHQFILATSTGAQKRAAAFQIDKAGTWSNADTTTQNVTYKVRLPQNGTLTNMLYIESKQINFGLGNNSYGGGAGVVSLLNATTLPTSDPVGGCIIMSDSGVLRVRTTLSAGALMEGLRLVHAGTTTSTAVGIGFFTGLNGAQQLGRIQTIQGALNVGSMTFSVQNASSGGPVDILTLEGSATAPRVIFPGGHWTRKEIAGSATDWEFWHASNVATYPNLKIAQGSAGVFNVPVSTGLANALTLTAPYNAAANWPVLSIVKYQTYANNPSDFISCAQTLDNGASFTYPFRVFSCGTPTDTSGIVDLVVANMTASPVAATTTQFLAGRFTTTVAGGASATFAGVVNGLVGEAILDPTSSVGVTGQMVGTFGAATHNKAGVTLATGRGVYGVLRNTNTGTITTGSAIYALVQTTAAGPMTTAHGVNVNLSHTGGATIGTYYGVRVQAPTVSGVGSAVTTLYGIYVEGQTGSGITTAYSIYVAAGTSFLLGQVLVGTTGTMDAAAALQVESTTKAFLPPRMTTTQRDAISSPPKGSVIYNTTTDKLNVRGASAWEAVTSV